MMGSSSLGEYVRHRATATGNAGAAAARMGIARARYAPEMAEADLHNHCLREYWQPVILLPLQLQRYVLRHLRQIHFDGIPLCFELDRLGRRILHGGYGG